MELKLDKTTKILLGAIAMLNVIMDTLGDIHSELLLGKGTFLKPAYVECVRGCQ